MMYLARGPWPENVWSASHGPTAGGLRRVLTNNQPQARVLLVPGLEIGLPGRGGVLCVDDTKTTGHWSALKLSERHRMTASFGPLRPASAGDGLAIGGRERNFGGELRTPL